MANDDPHASLQPQLRWSAGRRRARVAARAGGTMVLYALVIVPQNVYTVLSAQQETMVFSFCWWRQVKTPSVPPVKVCMFPTFCNIEI